MNALARDSSLDLTVIYLHSQRPGRQWVQLQLEHNHLILAGDKTRLPQARRWVESAGLVVFSYYRDPFAAQLLTLRTSLRKPWCFWGERMGASGMAWAGPLVRRWKLRALHRDPAAIWGIGEFASSRYRREFGSHRVHCNVPYFSDLRRFAASGIRTRTQQRTILFSGSLIPRKGVDVLADAFAQIAREFSNLRLVFVGDGEERNHLQTQLSPYSDRVEFKGFQSWTDLPKFYASADILCVPSRHDGWGLVVPEGLAAGMPVIGTKQTGAALELIHDGVNGWLVEGGNVPALIEGLRKAASLSPDALEAMSCAALTTVENHQLSDGVKRFTTAVATTQDGWQRANRATALRI